MRILETKINLVNVTNQNQFVCSTQFNIEEPETYTCAIQGPNSTEWAKAIEEELNQLCKIETWKLVHRNDIERAHWPLGGKWVYKVKRDVNGNIARFKAR